MGSKYTHSCLRSWNLHKTQAGYTQNRMHVGSIGGLWLMFSSKHSGVLICLCQQAPPVQLFAFIMHRSRPTCQPGATDADFYGCCRSHSILHTFHISSESHFGRATQWHLPFGHLTRQTALKKRRISRRTRTTPGQRLLV